MRSVSMTGLRLRLKERATPRSTQRQRVRSRALQPAHACNFSVETNPELGADICPPGCKQNSLPAYTTAGAAGDRAAGFTHRTVADLTKVAWAPYVFSQLQRNPTYCSSAKTSNGIW